MAKDPLLAEVTNDGRFRAKVEQGMTAVAAKVGRPVKIASAKRTLAQQKEKVAAGTSQTLKSYHRKRGSDDGSQAVDICDVKFGWNVSRKFWFLVGSVAMAKGFGWGGFFGLKLVQRYQLRDAIVKLRALGWPDNHPLYDVALGWDAAHWQTDSNWP